MKKLIPIVLALLFLFSCKPEVTIESKTKTFPKKSEIVGLASPIQLNTGVTEIDLSDFFPLLEKIDTVYIPKFPKSIVAKGKTKISINPKELPLLSVLKVLVNSFEYSLLLKKSKKINYTFIYKPKNNKLKKVQIMGEMNAWNPQNNTLEQKNGQWETTFEVEPGKFQYLLVLDGKQQLDPQNTDSVPNGSGKYNSLLKIGKSNTSPAPKLSTFTHSSEQITLQIANNNLETIVLYNNSQIAKEEKGTTLFINIPKAARQKKRTFIRVYSYGKGGFSNDLLIPLENGMLLNSPKQIDRTDFEAAVLYNTFIDRFFDGDSTNNRPTPDKAIHPRANYHGGDIAGITQKIESGYFKKLGKNTIWISPIVKNPEGAFGKYPNTETTFSAYHGYWPISFTLIDNRFGTENEFKKLVKTAHNNNLNVLLDFVANHVHQDHPIYKQHPDWATQLHLPDGTLNTERWDEHRLTTWFDIFLPTLDLAKPEVYNMLSDSAVYWIKKYNLDGFRHDATKHIPEIFWRTLTKKLKKQIVIPEQRRIYQIGETYGTPELISSYVGTGMLDAQFDFNCYDAIVSALAGGGNFKHTAEIIAQSADYYGNNHLMGNITGNQDRGRFISYASGDLSFSEDAKLAGWTRKVGVKNKSGYKKSAMLMAIIASIPGVPVIYYGDEIGMSGGNDPDNRRMMRFKNLNKEEQKLKNIATKILNFRATSLPLIYGEYRVVKAEKETFLLERNYFGSKVYTLINNSNEEKLFMLPISTTREEKFKPLLGTKLTKEKNYISIILPPLSCEIIENGLPIIE